MTEVKFEPRIVVPGDVITEVDSVPDSAPVVLGPGLYRGGDGERVAANRAGVLRHKRAAQDTVAADVFWVDSHSKRYIGEPDLEVNVIMYSTQTYLNLPHFLAH